MQHNYPLFGQYHPQQQANLPQIRLQSAQISPNAYHMQTPQPFIPTNNHQKLSKAMYTSTIQIPAHSQPQTNAMSLGSLMSMGRFVAEESSHARPVEEEKNRKSSEQREPLQFRSNGLQKGKMSASVIFPKSNDENEGCSSFMHNG
jgi:hypothetical protein